MLEPYFAKVAEFHGGFFLVCVSRKLQSTLSTEQQWTATLELKKEGVNIGHQLFCLSQELLQKRPKFRFFNFYYKFLLGIIFRGLCLKNAFDQKKSNKNIDFVGKERKDERKKVFCRNVSWESYSTKNHRRIHLCE